MGHLTLKIEDIPDKIRLVLEKGAQKQLILKSKKIFKRKELAKKLNVDESTIFHWKREDCHMKLKHLKKLLRLLGLEPRDIQNKVIGVKGESSVIVLFKKGLPFEIPIEIIAHLQADGSVTTRDCRCKYNNMEPTLIDSFINVVLTVFDTKIHTYEAKGNFTVELPSVIGKILVAKFGTFKSKRFSVPRMQKEETIIRYLKSFFDDEGGVTNSKGNYNVYLKLRNEKALKNIQKFLNIVGINPHKYGEEIRITRIFNLEPFAKKIGFRYPLQQNKLTNLLKKFKKVDTYEIGT
jgi:DNA-binding XRE family transcriptional regulator